MAFLFFGFKAAASKPYKPNKMIFFQKTGFGRQYGREMTVGFGSKQAEKAFSEATRIEKEANRIFSLGDTETNVKYILKRNSGNMQESKLLLQIPRIVV